MHGSLQRRFEATVTPRRTPHPLLAGPSSPLTDAEAIALARDGDRGAFGVLYERHHRAARRLAHTLFADAARADDAVAEAFARVRAELRHGGGPSEAFRASLVTALRAVADERSTLTKADAGDAGGAAAETSETSETSRRTGFEVELLRRAFARLPERSQAVLWHTELDDTTTRELSAMLGTTEDELGTLIDQARRELRQAQLLLYAGSTSVGACRDCAEHLGAYTSHDLRWRRRRRVRDHLEGCHRCASVHASLVDFAPALSASMFPGIDGPAALGRSRPGGMRVPGLAARAGVNARARNRTAAAFVAIVVAIAGVLVIARSDDPRGDPGAAVATTSAGPVEGAPVDGLASTTSASSAATAVPSADATTRASATTIRPTSTAATVSTTSPASRPEAPATTLATVRPVTVTPPRSTSTTRAPEPGTTVVPTPSTTEAPVPTAGPTTRPTAAPTTASTAAPTPTSAAAPDLSGDVGVASPLFAGRQGTLSATLGNPGPGVVESLEITIEVPAVFTILGASLADAAGACTTTAAVAACSVPVVGPGSTVMVQLDIAVSPAAGRSVEIVMAWSATDGGVPGAVGSTVIRVTIVPTCGSGKVPPGPPESCQP